MNTVSDEERNAQQLNSELYASVLCRSGVEPVRRAIKAGAEVNYRGADGRAVMHHAARFGDAEVVTLLREAGARADIADDLGWLPYESAAEFGHTEMFKQLRQWCKADQQHFQSTKQDSMRPAGRVR
jgi:ankyrin repeat protein